jgi:hypothetical protein
MIQCRPFKIQSDMRQSEIIDEISTSTTIEIDRSECLETVIIQNLEICTETASSNNANLTASSNYENITVPCNNPSKTDPSNSANVIIICLQLLLFVNLLRFF